MRLILCAVLALLAAVVLAWEKEDHEIFDLVSAIQESEGKGVTFYSWLEVPSTATTAEIAKAYRKKSMQIHPDKNPGNPKIHERFARLGVVSAILRNKESRERYDFFYKNGVPRWRGTGYYYSRFRPGLGSVFVFLVIVTSGFHYAVQHVNFRRDSDRIQTIIRDARLAAWGPRLVPIDGQRKVKVNLGGAPDSETRPRWIEMVVDANDVYFLDPSGDLERLDASTATPPAFASTWFIALGSSFSVEDDIGDWAGGLPSQFFRAPAADSNATAAPLPLSQHSSFSQLDDDITPLIADAPDGTQLTRAIESAKADAAVWRTNSTSSTTTDVSSKNTSFGGSRESVSSTSSVTLEMAPVTSSILGKRKERAADPPEPQKAAKLPRLGLKTDEKLIIISHSPTLQRALNALPYGIQVEIHRALQRRKISTAERAALETQIIERLESIKGKSHVQAIPLIPSLFGETQGAARDEIFANEIAAKAPWAELDSEDRHLAENHFAGLGCIPGSDYFGGKVHFKGTIGSNFQVTLKQPELGTSSRFARRFGSLRFLTLGIHKQLLNKGEQLVEFLLRPFILAGRVFRAFDAKDGNVFLVQTNEMVEGNRINPMRTIPGLLSLDEFLQWHNPLELDLKQTMAKWASRFALGRSNSAPVLRLEPDAILQIPDKKSQDGSDMTDGAGRINKAALRLIHHNPMLESESWPTAVQVRVAGAKGLLVMDTEDTDETPKVWLRPSQIKVKHDLQRLGDIEDPTLRIVDLLRTSHCRTQCRLSTETIINMAENGVPASVFLKLIETALVELVLPLLTWEGEMAMENLWAAVARSGGVIGARLARKEAVLARLKGYSEKDADEDDDDDDEGEAQPQSKAWWVDQTSGCPSSLEETVMHLIDAGFEPQTCAVLRSKLEKIVDGCLNRYIESYRIDIPLGKAAMAFIVPDEFGVLEEGQIFIKSSHHDFDCGGLRTDVLLGEVLITRHPTKLPTDIQRWVAVDHPQFRNMTDVIILSTKGNRRAADFLAGGDYDGDKGLLIWEPEIVNNFRNAPLDFSVEPESVAASFSPQNETVAEFLGRTEPLSAEEKLREKQKYLLSAVRDIAVVGKYSNWHLNAIYKLGYQHDDTIRLAYMFCKTLDGAKTGLQVLPAVFKEDRKKFDGRPPRWKEGSGKKSKRQDETNLRNITRPATMPRFIMDTLYSHTDKKFSNTAWGRELSEKIKQRFARDAPHIIDPDLTAPWLEFAEREKPKQEAREKRKVEVAMLARLALESASTTTEQREIATRLLEEVAQSSPTDVELIQQHVQAVLAHHKQKITGNFTAQRIERRQDTLRELSKEFAEGPELGLDKEEVARLTASYAYYYDCEQRKRNQPSYRWSRFPWDVAFRELCLIKTKASSHSQLKPVSDRFYERMSLKMPRRP
ncbi:RNA-dependent RNA polymerase [Mycena kentingensis (nom. inval.)]|nr:RNA-dependent RNA polymerase [Mycena kentingensis (nom. inval.)]